MDFTDNMNISMVMNELVQYVTMNMWL